MMYSLRQLEATGACDMKPREAGDWLKELRDFVAADQSIRRPLLTWFVTAVDRRLREPGSSLDALLGLRSRKGGRLTLHCTLPRRDQSLRLLAASTGISTHSGQADEILRRAHAGELAGIETLGRIPGKRQLLNILARE